MTEIYNLEMDVILNVGWKYVATEQSLTTSFVMMATKKMEMDVLLLARPYAETTS